MSEQSLSEPSAASAKETVEYAILPIPASVTTKLVASLPGLCGLLLFLSPAMSPGSWSLLKVLGVALLLCGLSAALLGTLRLGQGAPSGTLRVGQRRVVFSPGAGASADYPAAEITAIRTVDVINLRGRPYLVDVDPEKATLLIVEAATRPGFTVVASRFSAGLGEVAVRLRAEVDAARAAGDVQPPIRHWARQPLVLKLTYGFIFCSLLAPILFVVGDGPFHDLRDAYRDLYRGDSPTSTAARPTSPPATPSPSRGSAVSAVPEVFLGEWWLHSRTKDVTPPDLNNSAPFPVGSSDPPGSTHWSWSGLWIEKREDGVYATRWDAEGQIRSGPAQWHSTNSTLQVSFPSRRPKWLPRSPGDRPLAIYMLDESNILGSVHGWNEDQPGLVTIEKGLKASVSVATHGVTIPSDPTMPAAVELLVTADSPLSDHKMISFPMDELFPGGEAASFRVRVEAFPCLVVVPAMRPPPGSTGGVEQVVQWRVGTRVVGETLLPVVPHDVAVDMPTADTVSCTPAKLETRAVE